jgi:hypothetical protein
MSSKNTNSNSDQEGRFGRMQSLQRMKTHYQLLKKLNEEFNDSDSDDYDDEGNKLPSTKDNNNSNDNDESNTSTKTKQMWSGLKMAVKAGGDESKAFAMIGKAKAENARRATVRQQRRSIRDGSGGSSNSKGNEEETPPTSPTPKNIRRKVNHSTSTEENSKESGDGTANRANASGVFERKDADNDDYNDNHDDDDDLLDVQEKEPELAPEDEDEQLNQYWQTMKLNMPEIEPIDEFYPPIPPDYEQELIEENERNGIFIGKIPKKVIKEQKDILKERLWNERNRSINAMKKKEEDLLWREVLAKKRIETYENEIKLKLFNEKNKIEEIKLAREKQLAREFRRARESLEAALKNQNSQLGEVFGTLDTHSQQTMARKSYIKSKGFCFLSCCLVFTLSSRLTRSSFTLTFTLTTPLLGTNLPQPVEFRIRFLRSIKTKLPKGAYLIMITQYESLGGRPLAWSKIGTYGIGDEFPGTTKAVKHNGRYFDRAMKFEDSAYALCPSTKNCKPGFCFIIELFQLNSRTNPIDKPVGWTVLPMCNEEMTIVDGKFKLPMLKGRHSPLVQSYSSIERSMANDIDSWLCNIYFDIRKFTLSEMNLIVGNSNYYNKTIKNNQDLQINIAKQRIEISSITRLNRYINYDFINKRINMQNGKGKYSKTFGTKEGGIEDDDYTTVNVHGLFHRKKINSNNNSNSNNDDDDDDIDKNFDHPHKNLHIIHSNGNLMDLNNNDVEKRKQLLNNSKPHNQSFRHYQDGYGGISSKDYYSENYGKNDNDNDNDHGKKVNALSKVWYSTLRIYNRCSAYLTGNVFVPSESNGSHLSSRRYINPNTAHHERQIYDPSQGWITAKPLPHYTRANSSSKLTRTSSKSIDNNNNSDTDSNADAILRDMENGIAPIPIPATSELTEIQKEKKLKKKILKRNQKKKLKMAMLADSGVAADTDGPTSAAPISVKLGHGNAILTGDTFDKEAIVYHSVKFFNPDSPDREFPNLDIDGNDENLDSDGFSDDSDSSIDSDLDLHPLHSNSKAIINDEIFNEIKKSEDFYNDMKHQGANVDITVLERGLETEDSDISKGLHDEQIGKIVGIETVNSLKNRYFASSGLEKKIIRRLQNDGLRLDSDILDNNNPQVQDNADTDTDSNSNKKNVVNPLLSSKTIQQKKLWEPLDNRKDCELYDMSLSSNFSKKLTLLPGALAACKIRFLLLEAFGDLMGHKFLSFEFFTTLLTLLFAFWLRIYIHFIGQYIYLSALNIPIYNFELEILLIKYKYMSSAIQQSYEIALIAIGTLSNIIIFLLFIFIGKIFKYYTGNISDGMSTFFSSYGLMTILDPIFILIIDIIYNNYNCKLSSSVSKICQIDYTDSNCECFIGDWTKLWSRLEAENTGSGITGILITLIIYFSLTLISCFFYYIYLLYVHRNGRILDLWRRVNSSSNEFFIPDDNEISKNELIHICMKSGVWRGGGGDIRRVSVSKLIEKDADDINYLTITKLYAIYEMSMDGSNKKLHRQFLLMPDGYIIEVFSDFEINNKFIPTNEKEKQFLLMETWKSGQNNTINEMNKNDLNLKTNSRDRNKTGLFRGLDKA